jgi:hypothetical protein
LLSDCLFFSKPTDGHCGLQFSSCNGDFKEVYSEKIVSFYSTSIKNYCITTESAEGVTNRTVKMKGLSLKNKEVHEKISEGYHEQVDNMLKQVISVSVPQVKKKQSKYWTAGAQFTILF